MPSRQQSKRLQKTQAEVDEVVDIMKVNVEKILERDEKLTDLDNRADALEAGAQQFETTSTRLKKKYWYQNMKMMVILVGVSVGAVCIITGLLILKFV